MGDLTFLAAIASAILGYLLGSIPFGLVIVKAAGLGDIRAIGSGNIGATNVLRTGRKDLALATLLLDSGKAAIALLLAKFVFHAEEAGFIAGGAAYLGHCFPVWLNFKGGKGVATFFGVLLAGLPLVGAACGALWILTALIFRFSSLAGLVAAAAAPVLAYVLRDPALWIAPVGFCVFLAVLIFIRHHANISRLLAGTEPKIGAKKANAEAPASAPE
ncbi:MAG: glycerol-3-phosphate 1-O-acyltransferase PlsY [Hyphomonadaceae bacterium]|nr:glycerol-3-phosphate 1-O-acyltransferase PlsY [Hyphomonadaceae bacterium]